MKPFWIGILLLPWFAHAAATTELCIEGHDHRIQVEIADTFDSRARGLMARDELAAHAGMWFRYQDERPGSAGFWMYNTRIPLDIAYLNKDMEIVSIITMEPCPSIDPNLCPAYRPGVPYYSAVELNKGYFERYNINLGRKFKRCE
ncbi:DUF192 domain-containing protein [Pseudidiomarina sp.]|uniref:DUF192 domain-containing protein n=1 Tax=Pseudidiomarina sp. TaxID=2081707 RepID=UPI003A96A9F4